MRRFRREPLTLSAVDAAVLIGATFGAASGAETSFAMSYSNKQNLTTKLQNWER